jgi:hypothetical protein
MWPSECNSMPHWMVEAAIPYPGSVFGVMANHDEPGVLHHCVGFARVKAALGAESRVR